VVGALNARAALRDVWRGRTLTRAALNEAVRRHVVVSGDVLDLGAGPEASYRPHLRGPATSIRTVDAAAPSADLRCDLEQVPLPLPAGSFETILAFNVLEHVFRYAELLAETFRLLRPGGRLYVWVPFLIGYHPDPRDHFRYTGETLLRLLDDVGFADTTVAGYGGRFASSVNLALGGIPTPPLRLVAAAGALAADRLYYRVARSSRPSGFPLGYLAAGIRPAGPREDRPAVRPGEDRAAAG